MSAGFFTTFGRGTRWVLGLGCIAVLVAAALLWTRPPAEPMHDGKPLREWLRGFDSSYDSPAFKASRDAIRSMGTNVLPHLERYLRCKDWRYKSMLISLQGKLHLLRGPIDFDSEWHRRAARACGQFGEAGWPAFPAMMEAAQDRSAAMDVANSLSWMLPRSTAILTNLLGSTNPVTRARAADALGTAPSHPSVESMSRTALIAALKDPDAGVRMATASALGLIVTDDPTNHIRVVAALVEALRDSNPSVRGNAATSLGNFGRNAGKAVPELVRLLGDTNSYPGGMGTVSNRSASVLGRIDPEAVKSKADR